MAALDMAVVVYLYPVGHALQAERLHHLLQHLGLGGGFSEAAVERLHGIALRLFDQAGALAALRHLYPDPGADAFGERLRHQFAFRRRAIGKDQLRSEEHTSELQSLMRISYADFCLKKKKKHQKI